MQPPQVDVRAGRPQQAAPVLIVGATGQVGAQMLAYLARTPGAPSPLPTARTPRAGWLPLDLAQLRHLDDAATLLATSPLSAIYCFGSMTHVDGCESQPELALHTNARGPAALAAYASRLGIPYVYFSTEYVFDGSAEHPGPYAEDAPTNPLSVYGRTKLAGEQLVQAACAHALVVRTTVVYGPDANQKNYFYALMRNLSGGTSMRVPVDQVSTPTYNLDLITTTLGLVEAGASGIFHACGPELLGRLEFAQAIAERLGLDASLLERVPTAQLNQPAARPLAAGLATGKLQTLYPQLRMRTLAEALDDFEPVWRSFLQTLGQPAADAPASARVSR